MTFKCPQCGGPAFGRPVGKDLKPGPVVVCHNGEDGKPLSPRDTTAEALLERVGIRPCGWKGSPAEAGME